MSEERMPEGRQRVPDPSPDVPRPDYGEHNVLAVYGDMDQARAVIEDLEYAGVEANAISLLGRQAEEAAEPEIGRQRKADQEVFGRVGRGAVKGAAAGAGAGGAAGFLAGAAAFGIPGVGPVIGAGIWTATLGGAIAGSAVGFTAGGIASVKQSEAWGLTFEAVHEGKVVVGAHNSDEALVERAAEVMRRHEPERLERFDVEGARRM